MAELASQRRRSGKEPAATDQPDRNSSQSVEKYSNIMSSSRNEGRASASPSTASSQSLRASSEAGGKRLMSEDEVSSLVHSALLRARQATSSFSPRARSARSPLSQSSVSPRDMGTSPFHRSPLSQSSVSPRDFGSSPFHHKSHKRPPSMYSPRKASSALYVPRDEDIRTNPSLSKRSQLTTYANPRSKADEESIFSFDRFQTTNHSTEMEEEYGEMDFGTMSIGSSNDDTDYGIEFGPSIASVNSSEAIIRRVEEEIANARKAAQEANRRLAGVSANLKDAKAASAEQATKAASHKGNDAAISKILGESRNPSPSWNPNPTLEEDGSTTEALYDSAMTVIGEEFDFTNSNDDTADLKCHSTGSKIHGNDNTSTVPSTEPVMYPPVPQDADHQKKQRKAGRIEEGVMASPSEEIDFLLRSTSDDIGAGTSAPSVLRRKRTFELTPLEDVTEAPSEEAKTPIGTNTNTSQGLPSAETTIRTSNKKIWDTMEDESDLLVAPSIEASIDDDDIRASRDSAFDDCLEDDNLLEWLTIGAPGDQQDELLKEADNTPANPAEELNLEENGQSTRKPTKESNSVVDDASADEMNFPGPPEVGSHPDPTFEDALADEDEMQIREDDAAVDESGQDLESSKLEPHDSTAFQTEDGITKFGKENELGDEVGPGAVETIPEESNASEDAEISVKGQTSHEEQDEMTMDNAENGPKDEIHGDSIDVSMNGCKEDGDEQDEATDDDMEIPRCNSGDVFIYQVLSFGSTDVIDERPTETLMSRPSGNDIHTVMNLEKGKIFEKSEQVIGLQLDEAIEVATEPLQSLSQDQISPMNANENAGAEHEKEDEHVDEHEADKAEESEKISFEQVKCANSKTQPSPFYADEDIGKKENSDDIDTHEAVIEPSTPTTKDKNEDVTKKESIDDDHVTHLTGITEPMKVDQRNDRCNEQVMDSIHERSNESSTRSVRESVDVKETEADTAQSSPSHPKPCCVESSDLDQTHASKFAPSPRQIALVENRRAAQSQVEEARNAMIGEFGVPTGMPNPEKEIVHRSKKVMFKLRYPVPPPTRKPLQATEIIFNNQTPAPTDKLYLAKPKKDLKELLEAAIGNSIQRRSNAFGALKVLSTQVKNKMTLVRTKGFLDATVYAINDQITLFEDTEAAVASRTRAVNVILNVCEMRENRFQVLNHTGLANSLVKCMIEDKGEARALACSVFATLAKSPVCREPISKTYQLLETLSIVLKGDEPLSFSRNDQDYTQEEKKDYSGDDEASGKVFGKSYSSASSDNSSVGSSHNSKARNQARLSACAALLHLSKECSVTQKMCSSTTVLFCLVATCNETESPLHTKCLEIVSNLTRFPHNNAILTRYPGLVDTLITNGNHESDVDRLWSMRALQNLSSDPSSKTILATSTVLQLLSVNIMRQLYDEQLAAIAAMYNISTEPAGVVPLTNTKNVVATMVHVAHNPASPNDVRLLACDTLATLGLWLQTLAGAGTIPAGIEPTPLPTYVTHGWKRWEK